MSDSWFRTPSCFVTDHLRHIRTAGELKVLTALRHYTNSETQLAWPSITTLAEVCGMDRSSVSRAIARLVEAGFLARISSGKATGDSTRYRVTSPLATGKIAGEKVAGGTRQGSGSSATPVAGQTRHPSGSDAAGVAGGTHQPSGWDAAQSDEYQTTDQKNDHCAASAPQTPPNAELLAFECLGIPRSWKLTQTFFDSLSEQFPHVDILQAAKQARGWTQTNHKKTAKGMPRFLRGWMNRAQSDNRQGKAATTNAHASRYAKPKHAGFEEPELKL